MTFSINFTSVINMASAIRVKHVTICRTKRPLCSEKATWLVAWQKYRWEIINAKLLLFHNSKIAWKSIIYSYSCCTIEKSLGNGVEMIKLHSFCLLLYTVHVKLTLPDTLQVSEINSLYHTINWLIHLVANLCSVKDTRS